MDEKWFYVVHCQTNCKVITSIGVEPNDYYAQYKNHIGKQMYIVVAFVLNDNDIEKGGTAIPICCGRVDKMVKASRDSYSRVYNYSGSSFTYPKVQENLLREKGTEYFKGVELTGSNIGTEKDPEISLLDVTKNKIIPAIEEKVVTRYNDGGRVEVCVVYQKDGAGLHQD